MNLPITQLYEEYLGQPIDHKYYELPLNFSNVIITLRVLEYEKQSS
jgi:hypothetical protein